MSQYNKYICHKTEVNKSTKNDVLSTNITAIRMTILYTYKRMYLLRFNENAATSIYCESSLSLHFIPQLKTNLKCMRFGWNSLWRWMYQQKKTNDASKLKYLFFLYNVSRGFSSEIFSISRMTSRKIYRIMSVIEALTYRRVGSIETSLSNIL